jgi:hypothetical protein
VGLRSAVVALGAISAAQPRVGADRANLGAFQLLHALWGWLAGEGVFPHPPGGSTLAVSRQDGGQIWT